MMTADPNPSDFDIVVESAARTEEIFAPPPGWASEVLSYEPLTVRAHTNPTVSTYTDAKTRPPPSILTVPDVGLGDSTFSAFFQFCRRDGACRELQLAPAHYHACLPGHEQNAPNLASSSDVSMGAIVGALSQMLAQQDVSRVIGVGIGLGATALLRAASAAPERFAGLVLISPVFEATALSERVSHGAETALARQLGFGLSRRTKDRFLYRWLSDSMIEANASSSTALEEELDHRNPNNVLRILAEDTWREDASSLIKDIRSRVLVVTGKESSLKYHSDNHFAEFDPANSSRLDIVDAGSLIHDEAPDKLAQSLSLFLRGTGFS